MVNKLFFRDIFASYIQIYMYYDHKDRKDFN